MNPLTNIISFYPSYPTIVIW